MRLRCSIKNCVQKKEKKTVLMGGVCVVGPSPHVLPDKTNLEPCLAFFSSERSIYPVVVVGAPTRLNADDGNER